MTERTYTRTPQEHRLENLPDAPLALVAASGSRVFLAVRSVCLAHFSRDADRKFGACVSSGEFWVSASATT
jgi:hypothetical protein